MKSWWFALVVLLFAVHSYSLSTRPMITSDRMALSRNFLRRCQSTVFYNSRIAFFSSSDSEASKQEKLKQLMQEYQNKNNGGAVNKRIFDETIKFPTKFILKVIGPNDQAFIADIVCVLSKSVNMEKNPTMQYSTKLTKGGNYLSLTVNPYFEDASQLYRTYEAIGKDERVKFIL